MMTSPGSKRLLTAIRRGRGNPTGLVRRHPESHAITCPTGLCLLPSSRLPMFQVSGGSWCVSGEVRPVRAGSNCAGRTRQRYCRVGMKVRHHTLWDRPPTVVEKSGPLLVFISFFTIFYPSEVFMETATPADQTVEKVKKRYRKKKTKLEEAFPSYLQVTHTQTHTPLSVISVF